MPVTLLSYAEIGCWRGRSARAIADNLPDGGVLFAVDTWADHAHGIPDYWTATDPADLWSHPDWLYRLFLTNLDEHLGRKVFALRTDSVSGARDLVGIKTFDTIFIDAGHTYEEVKADILAWMPLLKEGGVMAGHDYDPGLPGVVQAVQELVPNHRVVAGASGLRSQNERNNHNANHPTAEFAGVPAVWWIHNGSPTGGILWLLTVLSRTMRCWRRSVHPQRVIFFCSQEHRNGGNTCRSQVFDSATGDYVYYLDDDNTLCDDMVLEDMNTELEAAGNPDWALFPINYLGNYFFHDPPALSFVDTANVIVKREFARWPDIEIHESDWVYIQNLLATRPYKAFPDFRPIVNYRKMGSGPGGRDGSQ